MLLRSQSKTRYDLIRTLAGPVLVFRPQLYIRYLGAKARNIRSGRG